MDLEITRPDGSKLTKTGVDIETVKKIVDALKPIGAEDRLQLLNEVSAKLDLGDIRELARFQGEVEVGRHGQAGYSMTPEVEEVLGITTGPRPKPSPSLDEFMSREIGPVEIAPEVQRVFDEHNQWCEGHGGQLGATVPLATFIAEQGVPAAGDGKWDAAVQRLAAMDETRAADPNFDGLMRTVEYRRVLAGAKKTYGDPDVMMRELDAIESEMKLAAEIRRWLDGPMVFEKPQGSAWHKIVDANRDHRVLTLKNDPTGGLGRADLKGDFDTVPKVFVVEHDWAKAFEGAQDYGGGEVHLPFGLCVFEFRISGRRVCALIGEDRAGVLFVSAANDRWVAIGKPDTDAKLQPLLSKQVEAICIALEAQVAETSVEPAPSKLNKARVQKGLTPLKDYHVVSLVRRSRSAPQPRSNNDSSEPKRRVRLHFRRGHWRHYGEDAVTCTHAWGDPDPSGRRYCRNDCGMWRTWLNWMLCGNPDLGFIDKHYKL